jgi:hypothetical protein
MQLITHQSHLDALPASPLKIHITTRYDQLSEDTDIPPNIILVENSDDITGPDWAFIGSCGLLSDLWENNDPGAIRSFADPMNGSAICLIRRYTKFYCLSVVKMVI